MPKPPIKKKVEDEISDNEDQLSEEQQSEEKKDMNNTCPCGNPNCKNHIKKSADSIIKDVAKEMFDKEMDLEKTKTAFLYEGLSYDHARQMPYDIQTKLKQCSFCQKYYNRGEQDGITGSYKNSMLTAEFNGELVCYHCLYQINYNMEARTNFDGIFGKTIYEYVMDCKDYHNKSKCQHSDECFLCDFLNGKKIEGIQLSDDLYAMACSLDLADDNPEVDQDETSKYRIMVTI